MKHFTEAACDVLLTAILDNKACLILAIPVCGMQKKPEGNYKSRVPREMKKLKSMTGC